MQCRHSTVEGLRLEARLVDSDTDKCVFVVDVVNRLDGRNGFTTTAEYSTSITVSHALITVTMI